MTKLDEMWARMAINCINKVLVAQPEQERRQSPWIAVEKELPISGAMLLVVCSGFAFPDTAMWDGKKWYFGNEYENAVWDEVRNPITKWMHLPSVHDEYTNPPKRPWVGLTAEQAAECWTTSATQTWKNFEAALKNFEAALKKENT